MKRCCRSVGVLLAAWAALALADTGSAAAPVIRAERIVDRPLIRPDMLPGDEGASICGPSVIRVPDWVENPLGRYYLYFAHHDGDYIRLAYADALEGPWTLHPGGVLRLEEQRALRGHIASPEVVIDAATRQIYLFSHGLPADGKGGQVTSAAVSRDGLTFDDLGGVVGPAYLRIFAHEGRWFALSGSSVLRVAERLGEPFKPVATIIGPEITEAVDPASRGEPGAVPAHQRPKSGEDRYGIRHVGTDLHEGKLYVYFSCVGHRPERILCTVVDLAGAPETWRARGVFEVLEPERPWEGADLPLAYSRGGSVIKYGRDRARELRDPAVYREGGDAWLFYSVAGEYGIGLARLTVTEIKHPETPPTAAAPLDATEP